MTVLDVRPPPARVNPMTEDRTARAALSAAFTEHAPVLLRYLRRELSAAEAEDVLGETFCTAWQQRHRFDPEVGTVVAWLFGIAVNSMRHHKRSWLRGAAAHGRWVARRPVEPNVYDAATDRVDARALAPQLRAALAALSDGEREVLLLSAWGQLGPADIASVLGIEPGAVRVRLHRARTRLKNFPFESCGDLHD